MAFATPNFWPISPSRILEFICVAIIAIWSTSSKVGTKALGKISTYLFSIWFVKAWTCFSTILLPFILARVENFGWAFAGNYYQAIQLDDQPCFFGFLNSSWVWDSELFASILFILRVVIGMYSHYGCQFLFFSFFFWEGVQPMTSAPNNK